MTRVATNQQSGTKQPCAMQCHGHAADGVPVAASHALSRCPRWQARRWTGTGQGCSLSPGWRGGGIAKPDRLFRNAAVLLSPEKSGLELVAGNVPNANRLGVRLMALIAHDEREVISATPSPR